MFQKPASFFITIFSTREIPHCKIGLAQKKVCDRPPSLFIDPFAKLDSLQQMPLRFFEQPPRIAENSVGRVYITFRHNISALFGCTKGLGGGLQSNIYSSWVEITKIR